MYNFKKSGVSPMPAYPLVVEKAGDISPAVLQEILRHSLANPAIHVTHVQTPKGHDGMNDHYYSELTKIEVTVEEDGIPRKLHVIIKEASQGGWPIKLGMLNVIFGMFGFCREVFWFNSAPPELLKLLSVERAAALAEIMPKVHYAYSNYHQQEDRQGCLLSNAIACCCCVLMTKQKEEGIILMKNLKEGSGDTYVDMKEVESTSGGGVKTVHMRMILEAMAHFHGAWMVWLRKGEGIGDMTSDQVIRFFKLHKVEHKKLLRKSYMKEFMSFYSLLAEANKWAMAL